MLSFVIAALLLQSPTTQAVSPAARNPAYSHDGRLAVSVDGDLWIVSKNGEWSRLTSGPGWDREPAWSADGASIVFSSDRAGNFDLWRVAVGSTNVSAEPERLTTSPLPDGQPAVARDGRVVFVRGRLGAATLWVRQPAGGEAKLTSERAAEQ